MSEKSVIKQMLQYAVQKKIVIPVLAEVIWGQIERGGITFDFTMGMKNGVKFLPKKNKLIIRPDSIAMMYRMLAKIKSKTTDKIIWKKQFISIFATILYYAIHMYNNYNRRSLVNEDISKMWYKNFFYNSIYEITNHKTTISKYAATLWAYPYMQIAVERLELPFQYSKYMTKLELKKIVGLLYDFNKTSVIPQLYKSEFDRPAIDQYTEWVPSFMSDFILSAKNQSKIIYNLEDLFEDENDFKVLTLDVLKQAYSPLIFGDAIKTRFPVPVFRELFVICEPLAQMVYSETLNFKIKSYPEWQSLCAKGLSYLS